MRLLFPGPLLVVGLLLLGCSSNDTVTSSPDGGSGGGSGGTGQSGTGGSAGGSRGGAGGAGGAGASGSGGFGQDAGGGKAGAGASDGGRDAGPAPKGGYVIVSSRATDVATVFTNALGAGFYDGPGNSSGKGCKREVVGKCAVTRCDYTNGGDQAPPPGAAESAGAISIGGTTPTFSLDYDAGAMKYGVVPVVPTDKLLYGGGTTITFTAAGGDVPAFADSLVAPTSLTVTAPVLPTSAFSLDTSHDLVFEWTGSSVGMLAFNIGTVTTSAAKAVSSSFVSCQFSAGALTGTIQAVLLQKLTKTDATTTATLGTDLSSTKEVAAGDHLIHLAVAGIATQADGKTAYAAGQITIL